MASNSERHKESLFKLIRKEEVLVWAGAGMSMYAGYPSANALAQKLVDDLTTQERNLINTGLPLPNLAEEYIRLKGGSKNGLIKILQQEFQREPQSLETHELLASIPHIKNIITTNYDTLFELAYEQNGSAIYSDTHIAYINGRKTQIFKVHGDLNDPESIIITSSDYNNFFKENTDAGTYWAVVRERISTQNILFLGYSLEDPNVSVVFDRITDSLGEHRKEGFLIAPGLPTHKVSDLEKKGIHYIDSTAEELIAEFHGHLKDHIMEDFENDWVSAETFRSFLSSNDWLPNLKSDEAGFKLKSLKPAKDTGHGRFNITLKNEEDLLKDFKEFTQGKKFGKFVLPKDKILDLDIRFGGIKMPIEKGIVEIEFGSVPGLEITVDVRFKDGFEFSQVPLKIYGSPSMVEVHLGLENAEMKLNIIKQAGTTFTAKLHYQHKELCRDVKTEIEFYTFISKIAQGEEFSVYTDKGLAITKSFPLSDEMTNETLFLLSYFKNLNKIEQHYNLRFANFNIDEIDDATIAIVTNLTALIEKGYIIYDWNDELTFELIEDYPDHIIDQLKALNSTDAEQHPNPLFVDHNELKEVELHGQKIVLGYKRVEFLEPYVTNLDEVIDNGELNVRIRGKSQKTKVTYIDTL